jgi:hypothetical protein
MWVGANSRWYNRSVIKSRPPKGGFLRFRAAHRHFHHLRDLANQFHLAAALRASMDDDLFDQAADDRTPPP